MHCTAHGSTRKQRKKMAVKKLATTREGMRGRRS
jgi:hypothetical protein